MEFQKKQQTNWKGNFMYIVRETASANTEYGKQQGEQSVQAAKIQ